MVDLKRSAAYAAGGLAGGGTTGVIREFMDVQNGNVNTLFGQPGTMAGRLGRPSVVYGLGTGALMGAWHLLAPGRGGGGLGPNTTIGQVRLWWAISGTVAGAASAAMPKQPPASNGGDGGDTSQTFRSRGRGARGAAGNGTASARNLRSAGSGGPRELGEAT